MEEIDISDALISWCESQGLKPGQTVIAMSMVIGAVLGVSAKDNNKLCEGIGHVVTVVTRVAFDKHLSK